MSRSKNTIINVIEPVRSLHLKNFEHQLKSAAKREENVRAEPVRRDENGQVVRDGVLNLPSRVDFSVEQPTGLKMSDIKTSKQLEFEPVDIKIDQKLDLTIFPFSWDEVHISFETGEDPKRLVRLRLWYLEWFQSRRTEIESAARQVVHSLRGPKNDGDIWHVCLDMGSAPAEALVELFSVLASRGVNRMTLGAELDRVEN